MSETESHRVADPIEAPLIPVIPGLHSSRKRLLLVPGLGQNRAHWGPFARWLAEHRMALLAVDPAGLAGRCTAPQGTYERVDQMAAALASACQKNGVTGVIGHSAGAPPALLAASHGQINTVTLLEPVPSHFGINGPHPYTDPFVPPSAVARTDRLVSTPGEQPSESLRRLHPFASPSTLRTICAAISAQDYLTPSPISQQGSAPPTLADRGVRTMDALAHYAGQVLILRGKHSALLSTSHAEFLTSRARKGIMRTVDRAGHSPHIDAPRATVVAFLGENAL
ncbi:alpha/beta fold hydrolase [Rhodococcus sp. NPDC060176]|uniref:alpha/beta fold hydrolase n=1 Tax=Rhodococcus sp. NPDC060176 TaxID=3347062 RepID=UPI00365D5455